MKLARKTKRLLSVSTALLCCANFCVPVALADNSSSAQQVYVPSSRYKRNKQYALAGMQTAQPVNSAIPLAMSGVPYGVNPAINVPSAVWKGPAANVSNYSACDSVSHVQAQKLVKLGKLDHARQVILTGLRSHPGDARLRRDLLDIDMKRSKYFLSQKQADNAATALREALYWLPGSSAAAAALNSILVTQGINASDAAARLRLADVFAGQNRTTDAFVEYRFSANLKATSAAYIGLGNIAYRFGEVKEAKGFYGQAVSIEPNSPATHRQLGLFDLAINDLVGANSELSRTLIIDPSDQVASRSLVGLWQKQVAANTNDVNNHLGLARAYLLAGDLKSAQQEYRQVVLIDPQNAQLPAARMGFKLALSRQEVARAFDAARGFESQGNFPAALQSIQSALRIEPNNIQLLNYDGSLWEKLGRIDNARSAYLTVLKEDQANTFAIQRLNALASAGGLDMGRAAPGMGSTANSAMGIAAASAGGAALGAALPAIMAPGPLPKIPTDGEVNSISGLLGHVRTVAAGEKMRISKGENTVQSLMQLMEKMNASGGAGGGGLDLSSLLGGAGGASGAPGASGLPPGIAALLGGGGAGASSSGGSGLPAGLSALIGSLGGASGVAALLSGMNKGGASGGSGLPPGIAALLGGGSASKSTSASGGLDGLPPNIQAIVNGTAPPPPKAASSSITAGVPASVAAILAAAPVPAGEGLLAGSKSVSAKKVESTKSTKSKLSKSTVKKSVAAKVKSTSTTAASSAGQVGAEVAAAGAGAVAGGGLAGFMPVIQMAMERFSTLEQQTKTMQQQLDEARQQLKTLQSRPCVTPCGGNNPAANSFASPDGQNMIPATPGQMPGLMPMTPQLDSVTPNSTMLPAAASGLGGAAGAAAGALMPMNAAASPPSDSAASMPAASSTSADSSGDTSSKKKEKQNKIRLEIEGVRPDILGLRFKVVLKNDENHSIPVPADPNAIMKKLKVSFPGTSVPAHGELHGNIKFSIP